MVIVTAVVRKKLIVPAEARLIGGASREAGETLFTVTLLSRVNSAAAENSSRAPAVLLADHL